MRFMNLYYEMPVFFYKNRHDREQMTGLKKTPDSNNLRKN